MVGEGARGRGECTGRGGGLIERTERGGRERNREGGREREMERGGRQRGRGGGVLRLPLPLLPSDNSPPGGQRRSRSEDAVASHLMLIIFQPCSLPELLLISFTSCQCRPEQLQLATAGGRRGR